MSQHSHISLLINNTTVKMASSTKLLGVQIDLSCSLHSGALVKESLLPQLRKGHLPFPISTTLFRTSIEMILTTCISDWSRARFALDWQSLNIVVGTAENTVGTPLPHIWDDA